MEDHAVVVPSWMLFCFWSDESACSTSKAKEYSVQHWTMQINLILSLDSETRKSHLWPYFSALTLNVDRWGAIFYQFFGVAINWIRICLGVYFSLLAVPHCFGPLDMKNAVQTVQKWIWKLKQPFQEKQGKHLIMLPPSRGSICLWKEVIIHFPVLLV